MNVFASIALGLAIAPGRVCGTFVGSRLVWFRRVPCHDPQAIGCRVIREER
jgi:hypothetical protein